MIINSQLINQVKEYFNLNIYETKVWHALLSKGVATAGEIAQISEVPRSRTYDVLESLEKQGFAVEKLGKPVKYIAVNPSMVLERLKSNILREADERSKMLAEIKTSDDYKQIELLHKQGITPTHSVEISGMIKGRNNIYNHLKDMISNAKKEVIISTNSDELVKKKLMKHLSNSLKRKDISVKIAVSGDITDEIKELNAEIKNLDINGRFCVIDSKEVLFMVTPESSEEDSDNGVWVASPFFASAFSTLFNSAWKKGG